MRRLFLLVGSSVALVALTGCPPTYPKCNNDDHCKEKGEVCVQGQCQECATDTNCKEGFICEANKCVPKPECTSDTGCGPGKKCRTGKCVAAECTQDADCGQGARCRNNRCVVAAPGTCSTHEDCPGGEECQQGRCTAARAGGCSFDPVLFEFNEYKLSGAAQSQLSALADCIKRQKVRLAIEGHADERGTEEFNLQLSNRRAASVKRYLTDLGVAAGDLDTIGYGETRPAQQGSSESAWAANRRVEFNKR